MHASYPLWDARRKWACRLNGPPMHGRGSRARWLATNVVQHPTLPTLPGCPGGSKTTTLDTLNEVSGLPTSCQCRLQQHIIEGHGVQTLWLCDYSL